MVPGPALDTFTCVRVVAPVGDILLDGDETITLDNNDVVIGRYRHFRDLLADEKLQMM